VTAETGTSQAIDPVAAPTRAQRLRTPLIIGGAVLTVLRNVSGVPAFAWLGSSLS